MSAECDLHGVDLLGYMDEAFCPMCRIDELTAELQALREVAEAAKKLYEKAGIVLPDIHRACPEAGDAWRVLGNAISRSYRRRKVK